MSSGCTTAFTSSPKSSLGTPNTAHVDHLGVDDQQVLGLLRVDVHAAGDDHVRLAVGEVEVAVLVDVADVAERRPAAARCAISAVFFGSLWYSNWRAAGEVDRARLAAAAARCRPRRRCAAVPTTARPTVPLCASHSAELQMREAVALGAGVVLVDDRAPPVDHLLLDRDRAGRGGVDRAAAATTRRSFSRTSSGSFSMRTNMVGTTGVWVTWYCSMQPQGLLGVEVLHDHRRCRRAA